MRDRRGRAIGASFVAHLGRRAAIAASLEIPAVAVAHTVLLRRSIMTKAWLGAGLAVLSMCATACGGGTTASEAGQGDGGESPGTGAADEPATSDPCSIVHPGSAKALPAGLVVPTGSPGLRVTFELKDQRVEATKVEGVQSVPAWTSKDTQIFSPDDTSGAWIETRDSAGSLSFQRNLFDPLGRRLEAPPDPNNPGDGFKNSERCSTTASIRVEIPSGAEEVRFYGSERSSSATKLLAWYRLR